MTLANALVAGLMLLVASAVSAQAPAPKPAAPKPAAPDFTVAVDALVVADFNSRIAAYAELRQTLEEGLPGLVVTDQISEIRRAEEALARRIRMAREGARQGNIFTPAINTAFKKLLVGVTKPGICAAILEDNPGDTTYRTGRPYSRNEPLSTVPPSVLGVLPALPDDVQYRFLDRDMILYDTRANMMLDRIPAAIRCARQR